jgi:hypothetical protein
MPAKKWRRLFVALLRPPLIPCFASSSSSFPSCSVLVLVNSPGGWLSPCQLTPPLSTPLAPSCRVSFPCDSGLIYGDSGSPTYKTACCGWWQCRDAGMRPGCCRGARQPWARARGHHGRIYSRTPALCPLQHRRRRDPDGATTPAFSAFLARRSWSARSERVDGPGLESCHGA